MIKISKSLFGQLLNGIDYLGVTGVEALLCEAITSGSSKVTFDLSTNAQSMTVSFNRALRLPMDLLSVGLISTLNKADRVSVYSMRDSIHLYAHDLALGFIPDIQECMPCKGTKLHFLFKQFGDHQAVWPKNKRIWLDIIDSPAVNSAKNERNIDVDIRIIIDGLSVF